MKKLLVTLLFLLSFECFAATYYLDPTSANGGSGTEVSPYNEFSDVTLSAGDTLLLKSGTTVTGQSLVITSLANITLGIYGGTARATIDCNNAVNYGIDATQDDELIISNIDVKQCLVNNVLVDLSTTGTVDVYISNMHCSDITAAQGSNFVTGNCFHASGASGALGRLNITYTDVTCSNVSGHCWDQRLEVFSNHIRSECNGAGIGAAYGAHCFTSSPRTQIWTTGWTNVSGTIYQRDRVVSSDQEYALCGRGGTVGDFCLTKVASTTSPATGEWSQTSVGVGACTNVATRGCEYVNFGIDPNSSSGNFSETRLARYPMGATYFQVEAQGAVSDGSGNEGDGIVCDDLTTNCVIKSSSSHDNERMGIQLRQNLNALVTGNIVFDNGENGILSQASIGTSIYNSTISNSGLGVRANTDYEKTLTIKNVAALWNASRNWTIDPQSAAQVTQSNNASFGGGTADENFTAGITSNPLLIGGTSPDTVTKFKLKSSSPLRRAGTNLNQALVDYRGRPFSSPPSIGAYEVTSGDEAASRTTASTRTARQ